MLLTIMAILYTIGFITTLKLAYADEIEKNMWWERDYIGCWIVAIVWPISVAVLLTMFSFKFLHDKIGG